MCKKHIPVEKKIIIEERRTSNWAKAFVCCALCALCYKTLKLFVFPASTETDFTKRIKNCLDNIEEKKEKRRKGN